MTKKVSITELAKALRYHRRTVYRRVKDTAPEWSHMPYADSGAGDPKISTSSAAKAFGTSQRHLKFILLGLDSVVTTAEVCQMFGITSASLSSNPIGEVCSGHGIHRRYSRTLIEGIARRTWEMAQTKQAEDKEAA